MTPEQRVGAAAVAAMSATAMSQADLIRLSEVSEATIRPLLKGEALPKRPAIRARIAIALGWPPDGLDIIERGEDLPTRRAIPVAARMTPATYAQVLELTDAIEAVDARLRVTEARIAALTAERAAATVEDIEAARRAARPLRAVAKGARKSRGVDAGSPTDVPEQNDT